MAKYSDIYPQCVTLINFSEIKFDYNIISVAYVPQDSPFSVTPLARGF